MFLFTEYMEKVQYYSVRCRHVMTQNKCHRDKYPLQDLENKQDG